VLLCTVTYLYVKLVLEVANRRLAASAGCVKPAGGFT